MVRIEKAAVNRINTVSKNRSGRKVPCLISYINIARSISILSGQ